MIVWLWPVFELNIDILGNMCVQITIVLYMKITKRLFDLFYDFELSCVSFSFMHAGITLS